MELPSPAAALPAPQPLVPVEPEPGLGGPEDPEGPEGPEVGLASADGSGTPSSTSKISELDSERRHHNCSP